MCQTTGVSKRKVAAKRTNRKAAGRSAPSRPSRRTPARKTARKNARKTVRKTVRKPSRTAAVATLVSGAAAGVVAAIAERLPWSKEETDPIALLETDHRRFEDLLKRGEETTARAVKTRRQLLDTITAELNVHEAIEERILYPALKPHPEARDIVLEGYQEHHVADLIVKELHALALDDEKWGAKFKVLKENIEHHIEEEEGEMFRTARAVMDRDELQALGARMRALKTQLES